MWFGRENTKIHRLVTSCAAYTSLYYSAKDSSGLQSNWAPFVQHINSTWIATSCTTLVFVRQHGTTLGQHTEMKEIWSFLWMYRNAKTAPDHCCLRQISALQTFYFRVNMTPWHLEKWFTHYKRTHHHEKSKLAWGGAFLRAGEVNHITNQTKTFHKQSVRAPDV